MFVKKDLIASKIASHKGLTPPPPPAIPAGLPPPPPIPGLFFPGRYAAALAAAQEELAQLQEREQRVAEEHKLISERIQHLMVTIKALSDVVVEEEVDNSPGLSEACLRVLRQFQRLTVPQLRQALVTSGMVMNYSNPLAVLHTTVRRLAVSGKLKLSRDGEGRIFCESV